MTINVVFPWPCSVSCSCTCCEGEYKHEKEKAVSARDNVQAKKDISLGAQSCVAGTTFMLDDCSTYGVLRHCIHLFTGFALQSHSHSPWAVLSGQLQQGWD